MKTRVLRDDYREIEIRPDDEFNTYLSLIAEDIKEIFKNRAGNYFTSCPACASEDSKFKFSKNGFVYRECDSCSSVYMTPRPTKEMLHDFARDSKGLAYWNSKIIKDVTSRKRHVFGPRVRWVNESLDFKDESTRNYCDFYSKYAPFVEEIAKISEFKNKISYKPVSEIKPELEANGFRITETFGEEKFSVITAFEVFDRFYDPRQVLGMIRENLEKGGLLFISTTSASGLDFQFLKEKSRNLIPPIHLNIFSVEGFIELLREFDFEILELSTPGFLDLQTIEKYQHEITIPKFLSDIINQRHDHVKTAFQEFLQRARLSSHMRILAQKTK